MRITGGDLKKKRLFCPKGLKIRPTTDKVREALFQIISANFFDDFSELVALDLFSGTGALGIEAISRGVTHCVFVEKSSLSIKYLKRNLRDLGLISKAKIIKKDTYKYLNSTEVSGLTYDLIFCDPPYEKGHLQRLINVFEEKNVLLSAKGVLIVEERKSALFNNEQLKLLELVMVKRYGDTKLFFFRKRQKSL